MEGPRKLGYCQRWKLGDKEVQTWAGRVFAFLSAGSDTKANARGGGALERGHGALLEPLEQRSDPLSGGNELALIVIVPTNAVALETERAKDGAGF